MIIKKTIQFGLTLKTNKPQNKENVYMHHG